MADTPDIKSQTEALDRAAAAIERVQKWTQQYIIGQGTLKRFTDDAKKALDAEVKSISDITNFPLEAAKKRWEALTVPATVKKGWQEFREEQAKFKRLQGPGGGFYRAAEKYGGGAGKAIADKGVGGAAVGGLIGLGMAAAGKAAQIAADNANRSIEQLLQTHQKLTLGGLADRTAEFAKAYGDNAIAAVKWGVAADRLNNQTAEFATRMGMGVDQAQKFTEFLARSSRMMGVDFGESAAFATSQIEGLGRSEDHVRVMLATVNAVSKSSGEALGGMGTQAGKVGGIFAKDLLRNVVDLSKETDLFRNKSETLVAVFGNLYGAAVKLGEGAGQALKTVKAVIGALGDVDITSFEGFVAGGESLKRLVLSDKQIAALKAEKEAILTGGRGYKATGGKTVSEANLPAAQTQRLREIEESLATGKQLGRGGLYARGLAAQIEAQRGTPEFIQSYAKQIYGGTGLGAAKLQGDLAGKGLKGQEIITASELLRKIATGEISAKGLSADQQKLLGKATRGESAEERAAGQFAVISQPLQAIKGLLEKVLATLVSYLGKAVSWLARIFGKGGREGGEGAGAAAEAEAAETAESYRKKVASGEVVKPVVPKKIKQVERRTSPEGEERPAVIGGESLERVGNAPRFVVPTIKIPKGGGYQPKTEPGDKGAFLPPSAAGKPTTQVFIPPTTIRPGQEELGAEERGRPGGARRVGLPPSAVASRGIELQGDGSATMKLEVTVPGWTEAVAGANEQIKGGVAGPKVRG